MKLYDKRSGTSYPVAHDYLEINKLSHLGDVERRINCICGRITVFRSTKEDETSLYNGALSGKSVPGTFSILLDGDTFSPSEHNLVGFGERFAISTRAKVSDYLSAIPSDIRERVLLSCGVGGLSDVYCGELTPSQERIVRILKGTLEPDKILILNDPFADVPERFREVLAERLTRFAWEKKAIVVVTKLSTRPETWIENEFISRVQLQRPRQATIGFGSGDESVNKLVQAVRKSVSADVAPTGKPIDLLVMPDLKPSTQKIASSKWFPLGIAALVLLAVLPFGLSTLLTSSDSPSDGKVSGQVNVVSNVSSIGIENKNSSPSIASNPSELEAKALLLDGFSEDISTGIRMAFLGKSASSSQKVRSDPQSFDPEQPGSSGATMQKLLLSLREGTS